MPLLSKLKSLFVFYATVSWIHRDRECLTYPKKVSLKGWNRRMRERLWRYIQEIRLTCWTTPKSNIPKMMAFKHVSPASNYGVILGVSSPVLGGDRLCWRSSSGSSGSVRAQDWLDLQDRLWGNFEKFGQQNLDPRLDSLQTYHPGWTSSWIERLNLAAKWMANC